MRDFRALVFLLGVGSSEERRGEEEEGPHDLLLPALRYQKLLESSAQRCFENMVGGVVDTKMDLEG